MLVIGVTGGIGSGKTAATDYFQEKGITVVDADVVSRVIVEPGRPALSAIEEHFGSGVLQQDGTLNRKALRDIIFKDDSQRKWLEQLTHPLIGMEIATQIQQSTSPYTILASPLLLETSQKNLVDRILVIDVSEETQIKRTANRDGVPESQVQAIIKAQLPRAQRRAQADDLVENESSLEALHQALDVLHGEYLQLAKMKQATTR